MSSGFSDLENPFQAASSSGNFRCFKKAMNFAGIDWSKFSPKDFRPTGAATAIEAGIDPSSVQAIGYWKTSDVFFRLAKPPVNYTDTEVLETQC